MTEKKRGLKKEGQRLKEACEKNRSNYAVSNNYVHSDDQSIKNMISQGKDFQKEKFETWG